MRGLAGSADHGSDYDVHKGSKGGMLIEMLDLFRLEVWTSSWEWMRRGTGRTVRALGSSARDSPEKGSKTRRRATSVKPAKPDKKIESSRRN